MIHHIPNVSTQTLPSRPLTTRSPLALWALPLFRDARRIGATPKPLQCHLQRWTRRSVDSLNMSQGRSSDHAEANIY